ncbi:MAG: hypothetical protein KGI50_02495 [Patescibacteria group bacterium]|nr:hypothetical protein [Patescibacteria group bacterium]MDE2437785.1 hypothetical protein [Patescibacteria group bacterium]
MFLLPWQENALSVVSKRTRVLIVARHARKKTIGVLRATNRCAGKNHVEQTLGFFISLDENSLSCFDWA